jgi:uncharacterized repeat protein (TIGR01451 family)
MRDGSRSSRAVNAEWKRRLLAVLALLLASGGVLAARAPAAHALTVRSEQHVVICHALGNGAFNRVNPAVDNVVHPSGHAGHPRDIIPDFDYVLSNGTPGHFPGHNWDAEGRAIYDNGCVRPAPPPRHIEVFASCVDVHDGTYDATFGYQSSNTGDVAIPAGGTNGFSPEPADRGQVTVFLPGKVLAAFTVTGITDAPLTWTVTYAGHTSSATVSASFGLSCTEPPSPTPDVPIGVFVACVVNHGSTYDAVFGYDNGNADAENIPIGEGNSFSPGPEDRGQPTVFKPGRVDKAITVAGIPSSVALTWTLVWTDTRSATATADSEPKCILPPSPPGPPPPVPELPPPSPRPVGVFTACVTNHGSTFDATFGYDNDNLADMAIPIGRGNKVTPGPAGQGQPETFVPGFVGAAFTVHGISPSQVMSWKVRVAGQQRIATARATFPIKCLVAPTTPVADATVTKTVSPGRVTVGQRVTFTIAVVNNGTAVLWRPEVADVLAGGKLQVLSATATHGGCETTGSRRVSCTVPSLAPGASLIIRVSAQAVAAGTATDRAALVRPRHLATPKNSVAAASVRIASPPPPPGGLG